MTVLGIVGGGQLGRMLALAAIPLGVQCRFLAAPADAPVQGLGELVPMGSADALARFTAGIAAATSEIEALDEQLMADINARVPLWPTAAALGRKRDRRHERELVQSLGLPQARWAPAATHAELAAACARIGYTCRVKTARDGYDGRGQWRVHEAADLAAIPPSAAPFVVEEEISFRGEFSQVAVRGAGGELRFWTASINVHRNGILVQTQPDDGSLPPAEVEAARDVLRRLAEALDYRGVLAVEFFRSDRGVLLNEFAPRVHNSGHWTIEGAVTSQFANHVRAVLGLPLGDTALRAPCITWNVLGDWPAREALLRIPGLQVHDYGKSPRPGRKIGHLTLVDEGGNFATYCAEVEALLGKA